MSDRLRTIVRRRAKQRAELGRAADRLKWLLTVRPGRWTECRLQEELGLKSRRLARAAMSHCVLTGSANFAGKIDGELTLCPSQPHFYGASQ